MYVLSDTRYFWFYFMYLKSFEARYSWCDGAVMLCHINIICWSGIDKYWENFRTYSLRSIILDKIVGHERDKTDGLGMPLTIKRSERMIYHQEQSGIGSSCRESGSYVGNAFIPGHLLFIA